jgi:hypothetical protein
MALGAILRGNLVSHCDPYLLRAFLTVRGIAGFIEGLGAALDRDAPFAVSAIAGIVAIMQGREPLLSAA